MSLALSSALFNWQSTCIPELHRGRASSIAGSNIETLFTNLISSMHIRRCTCNHQMIEEIYSVDERVVQLKVNSTMALNNDEETMKFDR